MSRIHKVTSNNCTKRITTFRKPSWITAQKEASYCKNIRICGIIIMNFVGKWPYPGMFIPCEFFKHCIHLSNTQVNPTNNCKRLMKVSTLWTVMDHDFGKYVDEFALICNITMYNAPFVEITCLMGDQYRKVTNL